MLRLTPNGLYCEPGDFYIDPKGKVENAVVTHAHSDHARRGAKQYFTPSSGVALVKARLGDKIQITGVPYGETFHLGEVKISFHPAGHILGSAQVRMEWGGEVWVASGDYKREPDPTAEPFEVVKCDVFVTEATFGTPGYRWERNTEIGQEILAWWEKNRAADFHSLIHAYSLGKTQRILGELAGLTDRPIYCAPAATPLIKCYREAGVKLAPTRCWSEVTATEGLKGELILAPPSFALPAEKTRVAFASGWMAEGRAGDRKQSGVEMRRNAEGQGNYDHGFVVSDHADWDDLVRTILETGARLVYVQHRGQGALVKHLRSLGIEAYPEEELRQRMPLSLQLKLF